MFCPKFIRRIGGVAAFVTVALVASTVSSSGSAVAANEVVEPSLVVSENVPSQPGEDLPHLFAMQYIDGVVWIGLHESASEALVSETLAKYPDARVVHSSMTSDEYSRLEQLASSIGVGDGTGGYLYSYDFSADGIRLTGNFNYEVALRITAEEPRIILDYLSEGPSRMSRTSDPAPHKGGARIYTPWGSCSSGFTVLVNGVRRQTTAAHCAATGAAITSPGGYSFGTITHRAQFPQFDMALMGGSTYSKNVYFGGSTGSPIAITGAYNPVLGASYCTSGATTFQKCGKVATNLFNTLCDDAGCTGNLVSTTGGTYVAPGDSGGPFYRSIGGIGPEITGIIIGGGGGVTSLNQKWATVSGYFGATIVTTGS